MNAEESAELMADAPAAPRGLRALVVPAQKDRRSERPRPIITVSAAGWTSDDPSFRTKPESIAHTHPETDGRQPSSGFETAAHSAEFADWLGRRILPLKFAYTGNAAITHDRLARSSGYQEVIGPVQGEVAAFLDAVSPTSRKPQVVEIGPGNGVHSAAFLRRLADFAVAPERYLALDFSSTLLDMARAEIARDVGSVDVSTELWDIETGHSGRIELWRESDDPLAFCFFGNTIGNVEEPRRVLSNIANSARSGDILLMSVTLMPERSDGRDPLEPYLTEVFRSAVLEAFRLADIDSDGIRLALAFDDGAVTGTVEFLQPAEFGGVRIARGEKVRCFLSRRFTAEQVRGFLDGTGWVLLGESDGGGHLTVAAVRK